MKIFTRCILSTLLFLAVLYNPENTFAQPCSWYGGSASPGSGYTIIPGCNAFSSSLSVGSGTYTFFTAYAGASYTVSTCGSSFDTQLSIYDENPGWTYRVGNDDYGPDCPSSAAASLTWTATYTGNHLAVVNRYPCQGHDFTGTSAILKIRQNSPTISSSNASMCSGETRSLTVDQSGGTWSGTGVSGSTFTAPTTAGNYTITYTLGNCAPSQTITVNTLSTAPASISGTTSFCTGGSTLLTAVGGTDGTGASYQWFSTASGGCGGSVIGTGQSLSVTTAGTYYVRRTGTCNTTGCASVVVTVNTYSTDPASITGTTTICSGNSTTLSVNGGSLGSGASWNWYSGSCGGTFVGTGASVTVSPTSNTDYFVRAAGTCNTTACASTTVTVNSLSVAPTGATGTTTICNGGNTTLTVAGGSAGTGAGAQWFTGSCGGASAGTGNSITVFPTSTTTYYVRYSGTCNTTTCGQVTVTVQTLSSIVGASASPTAICLGQASSTLSVTGTLGSNATWNWYSGSCGGTAAGTGANISVSPSATTTYYVRAIGTCNTTACENTTLTVNPVATVSNRTATRCNTTNLSITPTVPTEAPAGTTYSWSLPAGTGFTGQSTGTNQSSFSQTLTNTTSSPVVATYTVTPLSGSCTGATFTVRDTVVPTPVVNQPSNQAACHNTSTTVVSFTGTATNYTWTNSNTGIGLGASGTGNIASFTATNAGATPIFGDITVTPHYTHNGLTCTGTTKTFRITVNPLPVVTEESHTNLLCLNSNDGTVTLAIPATLAPYTYSINGGSTFQSSRIFTGLAAATYTTFKVQDANGCQSANSISVTLTQPTQLNISLVSTTNASCNGVFDGAITVSASGGTTTYQYSLSGGPYQPGATFNNLASGTYTVTVKDANNCTNTVNATINDSYTVTATISSPVNVSCPGLQDGGYTINGSGGVTPYNYANNGLIFGTNNVFTGLTVGTYNGFVRDSRGCLASAAVTITANPAPTAVITGTTSFCSGQSTVLSASSSTPGAGSITGYQWKLNGSNIGGATAVTYTATAAGNYTVVVTNSNACSTTSGTTTITVNPLPTISVNPFTAATCAGTGIVLTASGANTYTWSPATGLSATTGTSVTANPPGTTTYTVTGTDGNGCVNSTSKTVTVNNLPTVNVSPSAPTICEGEQVQLTASGANTYSWSPATGLLSTSGTTVTAEPTVTTTYSVTGTDINGCTNTRNVTVTVTPIPFVTITTNPNPATICLGQSITLTSNYATGNVWSNGAPTQSTTVTPTQSGSVTYTVFSTQSGCTGSASKTVTVNPVPFAVINPSPTASICTGGSVTLSAVTDFGTTYLWSPGGAGTQSISATSGGSYTVTITNSATGCSTTSSPTVVSVNSPPSVSVTANPVSGSVCVGNTVTLTATAGMSSYSWSNGLVGQSITVSTSGNYVVTVTDANGCTNTASKVVTINPLPTVSFSGLATDYCDDNCSGITLTGSPAGGSFTTTGATGLSGNTFTPCVAEAGTYTITYTYTDGNGCTNSSSHTTTVHPIPQPTVSALTPTTVCFGDLVILTTEGASSYLWSNGATTQSVTLSLVSETGNYNVTSTDAFGCSATTSPNVTVTINALPTPVISVVGSLPTTFCQGDDIDLTTGSYSSYSWQPGLQSTQTINVNTAGNYQVTVTDGNGCEGTSVITTVTVNPNPTPTISGSLTFCTGESTDLTSSAASTYDWSPNNETTQTITVTVAGTYSVDVVDANGCQGSASATVTETPVNPVITALSSTTFCQGESVTLYSSSTSGNLWTPSNETTQFITVTTSGTITLNVTAGSCQGTDNITVTVNPLPNVSFLGLAASYCNDAAAATLTGNPVGGTFSGPGISGNSFNPAAAGNGIHTITYVYTDGNGCEDSQSQTTEVTNLPTVTFSGLASQYCANNPSVTLFGSPAGGTFTGTGISGNTFNPSVGAGNYTITYTYSDGNGCESSSSQTVTVNPVPVVSFIGLDTDYCADEPAATLSGTPGGGSFSGNGIIGNQFFPTVPGAGTHTITYTVSNAYGCSTSSSQPVTVHAIPTVSFIGFNVAHAYCVDAAAVTLTGSPVGGTFTGTGISGNTFSPATAGVGSYTITYTYSDGFGCSNTSTQNVTVNPLPTATATPLGSTTFCDGGNVVIYSSSGTGNLWSNAQTTQFITVTSSGSYSVTITDGNGCSATSAAVVVVENPLPTPVISANGPTTFCAGDDVTLSTTIPYIQYLWSTGATTSSITVDAADSYTVAVTDGNGCSNTSAATTVTVNALPNAAISPAGTVGICNGSSINLQGSGGTTYLWSPGNQTTDDITVATAGTYFVTVTDANGCTAVSASTTVVVNSNPAPTVSALGSTTFCQGSSVTLVSSASSAYLWSPNGETNQIISATTSGSYSVTVTDANGCVGTSSPAVTVTVNPLPVVSYATLAAEYCVDAPSVLLTVSPAGGFFTGPITGNTFNPALAGVGTHVITYQYTNGNGCTNSYGQTVIIHPLPVVSFTGLGAEYCVDAPAVTLTGSPVGGVFTGPGTSGLQFNPATAGAGTHTITYTYTDGNGCVNSESHTVIVHPLPVVSFTGLDAEYCIDEATATLVPSPAGGTFAGTGISGNTFDPATAGVGTWTITYTYTDANTCTNSISHTAIVHPLPVVTFAALANQYCITETSVTLLGNPVGGTFSGTGVTGNTFNPSVAGVGSYTLTYTYTDANGCTNFATRTAVVVPLPVVTFTGLALSYCVDAAAAPLTGNPVGGTFSGTGISGNNFVPSQAGVGTHTVIYTYTDGFGCTNSTSQSVTVTPLPVINFTGLGQDYCINEPAATLTGNPPSGTFSGPGISGNTFTPSVAGAGTHTITFSYTNGNGCTGVLNQSVTVYALPVVSITPITQQFCVTETTVGLSATPAGGTFSGSGITGTNFNPSVAGVGTHNVVYSYTDVNGCTNSANINIVVLALPTITFNGLSAQYCVDASSVTLTSNPVGGIFSGPGISGNVFSPSTAGVGTHTIVCTYTDGNGCTNTTSQNVIVTPLPLVSVFGLAPEYCIDAASAILTGNPSGGSFSGAGMSGGIFTPSAAGLGTHTIMYSYTDGNNCTGTVSVSVTVNDLPVVTIDNSALQFCVSETSVILTATPSGGTFSGNGVTGSMFNPSSAGAGTHEVIYEYGDNNGCESSDTVYFEVLPLPVVDFSGLALQYCVDAGAVTLTGNPAGGLFSGDGISGDVFTPDTSNVGSNDITYTYTDGNGCANSAIHSVSVYSLPAVQFSGLGDEYCADADDVQLTGLPAGGAFIGPGMVSSDTFSIASAGVGSHTIIYAFQDNNGCIGTAQNTTEIHPLPSVSFTGIGTIYCLESDSVIIVGTPTGGYFSGPGMSDSIFYPNNAGAGTHVITYTYYDANGCSASYSQTVNVYQLSQPQVVAGGSTTFCIGDDVTLTAQPPFVSYLWSTGETTQSILVDTESDNYMTVQDVNGCRATSDTIHVTVNPLPVVDLGNDVSVCLGNPVTFDAGAGFADYVWFPGGETTQTITVTDAGDYRASVTDANGCFNYDEVTLVVFTTQVPVITANGSPSICDGETLVLNAGNGFQQYLWSNTVNTQLNNVTQTGSYTVTTVDANGCTATSTPYNVTVIPLPVVTIFANGDPDICDGDFLTLSMPSGYSSYLWSTGATTTSINVTVADDYYGSATNSAGCSNVTSTIQVTVNPQPEPVIIPQGPITLCFGETIDLDAGNEGYDEYNWFRNLSPLNVHTQVNTVGTSGNYTVEVIDTNGCGQGITSPPVVVTVLPEIIPIITISTDNDTLFSTAAVTYQWYLNGDTIGGADQQYYVPTESGNYMVVVTDNNDCAGSSAILEYSYTDGIADGGNVFSSINLFPNPGKGRFTLMAEFNAVTSANIVITDMLGHSLISPITMKGVKSLRQEISLEEFANGVYFVRVMTDDGQKVIRYIKE